MSETTQIFPWLLLTTKWMNVPSFAKIGRREIYDDILTIVIRFMGRGFTIALLRSRDSQPEDFFFRNFFHQDLGEEKKRNTSNRFFIESKWKLPKKSKTKKCGSKPPINPSPIKM